MITSDDIDDASAKAADLAAWGSEADASAFERELALVSLTAAKYFRCAW